jgi:hypothetical protein
MDEVKSTKDLGEIVLETERALIMIPKNTVEIKLSITVFADGKLQEVSDILTMHQIRDAVKSAEENYLGDDEVYTLTDLGRQIAERLVQENG